MNLYHKRQLGKEKRRWKQKITLVATVFLQRSKILYWENKSEDRELKQQNQIVIRIGQRTHCCNFAYYLCCLSIFSATLLICSQTLISVKRI